MSVRKITWPAFFICLGIILPMALHMFSLGRNFLPMHIPVLIGSLLLGAGSGIFIGAITPLLSCLLTGMPPLMPPIVFMMMFELALYGIISAVLYKKLKLNIYISLIAAIIAGRIFYGAFAYLLFPLIGLQKVPFFYPVTLGLIEALPGIILQLIIVPPIVKILEKHIKINVGTDPPSADVCPVVNNRSK